MDVAAEEWQKFFDLILSTAYSFEIEIIRNGTKVDFFIKSKQKLDLLNNRLFPFYLSDEILDKEYELLRSDEGTKKVLPFVILRSLFKTLEKASLKNKEIVKVFFKVHKFNPFKNKPIFKIIYAKNENNFKVKGLTMVNLDKFLAFQLSNSINSEISKVKPVLATGNLNFARFDEGVLDLWDGKKLSVKSYDFWRHSLILGQSGSGKSFFIKLFIEDLFKKTNGEYSVVLIDPHASLDGLIDHVGSRTSIDFKNVSTNLFVNIGQPVLSTELTIDLLSTVLDIRGNQNLARVLKYALNLLFGIDKMNLLNLKNLLTDSVFRRDILKEVQDRNILQFFETEYQQLYTAQYSTAVLPIINLISELDFVNNVSNTAELANEINNNFLVSLPIKQTELGTNITKVIGGAVIQQVFTLMQAGLIKKKVILIVDEVSVVQTPSLIHILSEARKFGLTVVLAQQYLMQVGAELLQSIFANTVNYFCFKLARDDAEVVARNLNCEVEEYFLKNKNDPREMMELGVKLLTDLNPRQVISRIMADDNYYSPFKSKTVKIV